MNKKIPYPNRLALGLISGTSADGVSAALIKVRGSGFEIQGLKKDLPIEILNHAIYPYPRSLRDRVLAAIDFKTPEISRLNFELGEFFAQSALRLIRQSRTPNLKSQILVIGSHGQTIYHGPDDDPPNTLQIAEPAVIAERTGIPVVADFRPGDIAAGGQGAPLIGFFDWYCFRSLSPLALLNIGGIANLTLVAKKPEDVLAFDTGPGNCLMDMAINQATHGRLGYDRNGRLAGQGHIDEAAIERAIKNTKFFRKLPPKSTGRELFNADYLRRYFGKIKTLENRLATLAAFSAETIALAFERYLAQIMDLHSLIVSGGGTKNQFLINRLQERLSGLKIQQTDGLGIPSSAREAAAFALLAHHAIRGHSNHLPRATGASGAPQTLGKCIFPGSKSKQSE